MFFATRRRSLGSLAGRQADGWWQERREGRTGGRVSFEAILDFWRCDAEGGALLGGGARSFKEESEEE